MDAIEEDIKVVGVNKKDAMGREKWRKIVTNPFKKVVYIAVPCLSFVCKSPCNYANIVDLVNFSKTRIV